MTQITLFHFNDIHSHFDEYLGYWPEIRKTAPESRLVIDSGDFADFRSVMVSGTQGLGALELLEGIGTAALAVGNNEFFGGPAALRAMIGSGFPLLSCNLFSLGGSPLPGLRGSLIAERQGIRFLVIGISPFFGAEPQHQAFLKMDGLSIADPRPLVKRILERERGRYDYAILLSHAGLRLDQELLAAGADLIAGGHSHTLLEEPLAQGKALIIQSGAYGAHADKLVLEFGADRRLIRYSHQLLAPGARDPEGLAIYQRAQARGAASYSRVIAELPRDLSYDPYRECESADALCDMLYAAYPSDLALINNGVIAEGFVRKVSRKSLLESVPSPLNPTLVPWSGAQIAAALRRSFDPGFIADKGIGAGYRGTCLGALSVSWNVEVTEEPFRIRIDGKPLDPGRAYRVISDDYLQRGSGYAMLRAPGAACEYHPGFLRDLLEKKIGDPASLSKLGIRRIRYK